MGCLPAVDRRN